ncbi:methyl-accepting chemotaxis protein, partial [Methylobacterium sp. D53M]
MSLSIGKRILLGFFAITVVVVALGLYALEQIGAVRDTTDAIVRRDMTILRQLDDLGNDARDLGLLRRTAVITMLMQAQGRATQAGDTLAAWRQTAAQVENRLATTIQLATQYRTQVVSAERVAAWDRIAAAATAVQGSFREVRAQGEAQFAAIAQQDVAAVEARNAEIARLQAPFLEGIKNLRAQLDGGMALGQRAAQEVYERSRLSIYLTLAAAVLLAVLITWLISRAVVRPLETVMAFVGRVGEGDLSGQLAAGGRDEI